MRSLALILLCSRAVSGNEKCGGMPAQTTEGHVIDCCRIEIFADDRDKGPFGIFDYALCHPLRAEHLDPYLIPRESDYSGFFNGQELKLELKPWRLAWVSKPLSPNSKVWRVVSSEDLGADPPAPIAPEALPSTDPRSTLAIYMTYSGAPGQYDGCTEASFRDRAFSPGGWADMLERGTYGITTFPETLFDWVDVELAGTYPTSLCSWSYDATSGQYGLTQAAEAAALAKGFDSTQYHHTIFITPPGWCGQLATGAAAHGQSWCQSSRKNGQQPLPQSSCKTWYYGDRSGYQGYACNAFTVAHEIGHNFGYLHAGGLYGGTPQEYGDAIALMGATYNLETDLIAFQQAVSGYVPTQSIYKYSVSDGVVSKPLIKHRTVPDASLGFSFFELDCLDTSAGGPCQQQFDSPWSDDVIVRQGSILTLTWYSVPGSTGAPSDKNHRLALHLVYDNDAGSYLKAAIDVGSTYHYGGLYSIKVCEDPELLDGSVAADERLFAVVGPGTTELGCIGPPSAPPSPPAPPAPPASYVHYLLDGDSWAAEISWDLACSDGASASGGGEAMGTLEVTTNSDCDLTMEDTYGDGWNGGTWKAVCGAATDVSSQDFSSPDFGPYNVPSGYAATASFTVECAPPDAPSPPPAPLPPPPHPPLPLPPPPFPFSPPPPPPSRICRIFCKRFGRRSLLFSSEPSERASFSSEKELASQASLHSVCGCT